MKVMVVSKMWSKLKLVAVPEKAGSFHVNAPPPSAVHVIVFSEFATTPACPVSAPPHHLPESYYELTSGKVAFANCILSGTIWNWPVDSLAYVTPLR